MSRLSAPPSVRWLDGWCGAGDNLGAGLLYQAEYRSELSGSTKYRATAHILSAAVQRAAESILYNATSIHFSVNSAVELLSQDTALIRNNKRALFGSALKPCQLNIN